VGPSSAQWIQYTPSYAVSVRCTFILSFFIHLNIPCDPLPSCFRLTSCWNDAFPIRETGPALRTVLVYYDEKLGILRPYAKINDHFSETVLHCLLNIFAAISVSRSPILLYPLHENGPYRDNKSPTWHGNTNTNFLNFRLILAYICTKKPRQISWHSD
jgi:hypothetical protein